jgi:hypothetical protein
VARRLVGDLLGARSWILVAVVLVFGCVLRLWSFDRVWINPDEGIYFSMVTWVDWGRFWSEYTGNAHPPLYYLLLRFMSVVAVDVTFLRSISLVFGCAWIATMFLFARECVGRGAVATLTGLGAALLVAVSDSAIEMSQLIRPYTTQIAAMTYAMYFMVRYLRDPGRKGLPAYATWMILAVLTHYSTLLVLAGVALACLGLLATGTVDREKTRALLSWNAPVLVVSVLCYWFHIRPNLDGSEIALGAMETWLEPFMMDSFVEVWPRFLGVLKSHIQPGFEGPAAVMCLVGLGLAGYRKNGFLVLSTLATLGVAVLASVAHKYPFGESRHSLYLLVVVAPPIAFALAWASTSGWRVAIPALGVMLTLIGFREVVTAEMGSVPGGRARESTLLRIDLVPAREFLRKELGSPGIVLMSVQTYCVLMPELHRERNAMKMSGDGTIGWFRWGSRTAVVMQAWVFRSSRESIGQADNLYTFVQNVDDQLPVLELGRQHKALLLLGEWSTIMPTIERFKDGPPGARALIGLNSFVPGFAALEFDIARYCAIVSEGLQRGR